MNDEAAHNLSDRELCDIARGMLEQTPRAVAVISVPDCVCIYRNRAAAEAVRRLGMYDGELLGMHPWDILPEWERVFAPAFEECRSTGRRIADRRLRFDYGGCPIVWQISLIPNLDESGRLTSITATIQDFTEYARAEASLEESNRRLEAVMEALPIGVVITDAQGGVVRTNGMDEKIWGPRPPTQGVEDYGEYKAWWADTGKPVAPDEWASAQAVLKGESVVGQFLEIQRFDGARGFIINSASPIRDAEGKIVGSAVAIQDVTRLTVAERREREIEERKLEFYRRTLELATAGKMILTSRGEIERIAGSEVARWDITSSQDLRSIRHTVSDMVHEAGMDLSRAERFVTVVGEVTTNAIKHASGATASFHRTDEGFMFVASDRGVGIREVKLPDVALMPGYSTAGTLGMGYKIMISFADRVYLATGPEGTMVGLEMKLHSTEQEAHSPHATGIGE